MGSNNSKTLSKKDKQHIVDEYGISMSKIDEMVKNFQKHCDANNSISKSAFVELLNNSMSKELAEKVFDNFDRDGNGRMDAKEYILMMGLTHGGSIEQKLKASFQMFDSDGNGTLDPQEIKEMFLLIVNQRRGLSIKGDLPPLDEKTLAAIDNVVKLIFSQIDTDKSGTISYDEFIEGYSKHNDICSFFKQL